MNGGPSPYHVLAEVHANPEARSLDARVGADGAVSGTLGSPNGAVPISSGRIAGNHFALTATLGTGLVLTYDGVVSHDTIRGTWKYDKYDGVFIGRRGSVMPRAEAAPGGGTRFVVSLPLHARTAGV